MADSVTQAKKTSANHITAESTMTNQNHSSVSQANKTSANHTPSESTLINHSHSSVTQAHKTSANHTAGESTMTNQSHFPDPATSNSSTSDRTAGSISTSQSHPMLPHAAKHSQYVCHILFLLFCFLTQLYCSKCQKFPLVVGQLLWCFLTVVIDFRHVQFVCRVKKLQHLFSLFNVSTCSDLCYNYHVISLE